MIARRNFSFFALMLALLVGCTSGAPNEAEVVPRSDVTSICCATGAWAFGDDEEERIKDIWMEAGSIHVRDRATDVTRTYKTVKADWYKHEDGEVIEFKNDEKLVWHRLTGETITVSRASYF